VREDESDDDEDGEDDELCVTGGESDGVCGLSDEISNFRRHHCDVVMQLDLHIKWHDSRTPTVNYKTAVISSQVKPTT